jgi:hypothetical protein
LENRIYNIISMVYKNNLQTLQTLKTFQIQKQIFNFFDKSKQSISASDRNYFIQTLEQPSTGFQLMINNITENHLEISIYYIKTADMREKTNQILNIQDDFNYDSTKHYNLATIIFTYDEKNDNLKQSYNERVFSSIFWRPPQVKAYFKGTGHFNPKKEDAQAETALAQYTLIYKINTFDDMLNFISQIKMSLFEPKNESFIKNNITEFLKLSTRLPSIVNSANNPKSAEEHIIYYNESEKNFRYLQNLLKNNVSVKLEQKKLKTKRR